MKIWEIDWVTGREYKDQYGMIWIVKVTDWGACLVDIKDEEIIDQYDLKHIFEMDFKEIIDWSKVEVDTPVLVKHNYGWIRRRFSHFDKINNVARVFTDGMDSYTVFQISENHRYDEYILSEIKLYKEEK